MTGSVKSHTVVASPCVRNCCLNEKDICVGCFRHIDEITGWTRLTEPEKKQVLNLCQQRRLPPSS